MKCTILLSVLSLIALLSLTTSGAELVLNPGMEDGDVNWTSWTPHTMVTSEKHSGNYSLQYDVTNPNWNAGIQHEIPVTGGAVYTISVWTKTNDANMNGNAAIVFWKDSNGTLASDDLGNFQPGAGWIKLEAQFTAPLGAVKLSLNLRSNNQPYLAWFDDVSIQEVVEVNNVVLNPGMENGDIDWTSWTPHTMVTTEKHSGVFSLRYDAETPNWNAGIQHEIPITGGADYTISLWTKSVDATMNGNAAKVFWKDSDNTVLGSNDIGNFQPGAGWVKLEQMIAAPAGAVKLSLNLRGNNQPYQAWFDDISISTNLTPESLVVEDFSQFDISTLDLLDSTAEIVINNTSKALQFTFGNNKPWPHVALIGQWDLSAYNYLKADLTNSGTESIKVGCRVDNPGATGDTDNSGGSVTIGPGDTRTLIVRFNRQSPNDFKTILQGMQFYPDGTSYGATLDPKNVIAIQFFGYRPAREQTLIVDNIRAVGIFDQAAFYSAMPEPFMSFIDALGQYKHRDWSGKTHGIDDLVRQRQLEEADLAAHPGPTNRDVFGGWTTGPTLTATGHFRTTQYNGKWWLVTPEGHLFWSFGITTIKPDITSFVDASVRAGWFEDLPPVLGSLFSPFYGQAAGSADYLGLTLQTYNFGAANLLRKYGTDWEQISTDLAPRRLKSWGMNTMGCWVSGALTDNPQMPYATWIFYWWPRTIKSWGVTSKAFPDVYDPDFKSYLESRAMAIAAPKNNDPYCIGFFIDNELAWGDVTTIGKAVLKVDLAQYDQPAKIVFIDILKNKYGSIENLNQTWGSSYSDWSDFNGVIIPPAAAKPDLEEFCRMTAEKYYSTCLQVMRQAAPNKLYLGSRFAEVNSIVAAVAEQYCDVVSFNLYRQTVAGWLPPAEFNKPVIIGEFHFGAMDRGPFGPGLVPVGNQQERAQALEGYITGALKNPLIIGAHWFQYRDEATSGRTLGTGENHQVGFVDICDTPYQETVDAARDVGYSMYNTRLEQ